MKNISLLFLAMGFTTLTSFGQEPLMTLTFTGDNNGQYVQLDSIKVMNRTQGGDTVLYWPDTVLNLLYVGIPEPQREEHGLQILQNYPNPAADRTTVSIYVPEKDNVNIIVSDILGREISRSERILDAGIHSFRFVPGSGNLYFFTACWRGMSGSIKILKSSSYSNIKGSLEYLGSEAFSSELKEIKDVQDFVFSIGDELLYVGYADSLESGILDSPEESTIYAFQYATNIPCPGTPTVEYWGQVYNTIQIFSQCWLKENLNAGGMIEVTVNQSDNGFIEKYCYNNNPDSCLKYGGLYQWPEMMLYTGQPGTRGICPPGWHLPSDEEWKVLEGAVDSQYGIGDDEWDNDGWNGYDVGTNLKSTSGWDINGNGIDLFGFSGLPGGSSGSNHIFYEVGERGNWHSSTKFSNINVWGRNLEYLWPDIRRGNGHKMAGTSVRCLRD